VLAAGPLQTTYIFVYVSELKALPKTLGGLMIRQPAAALELNPPAVEQDRNPVPLFQERHLLRSKVESVSPEPQVPDMVVADCPVPVQPKRPPQPQQLVPNPDAVAALLLRFVFTFACLNCGLGVSTWTIGTLIVFVPMLSWMAVGVASVGLVSNLKVVVKIVAVTARE